MGCLVLFVEHAVDGTLRGLHIPHGRLRPSHLDNVSAPCAKFDSIPAKIQQAKVLRTMVPNALAPDE